MLLLSFTFFFFFTYNGILFNLKKDFFKLEDNCFTCHAGVCCPTTWIRHGCLYDSPAFDASLPPPPTSLGHRTAPGWAACVAQQLPASCLLHAWQCVYINAALSFAPPSPSLLCPQAPFLLLHLNTFLKFEDRIRFTNSEASTESFTTWFPLWLTLIRIFHYYGKFPLSDVRILIRY